MVLLLLRCEVAWGSPSDHPCADAQNVDVVVLYSLMSGVTVVTDARPNSDDLTRGAGNRLLELEASVISGESNPHRRLGIR